MPPCRRHLPLLLTLALTPAVLRAQEAHEAHAAPTTHHGMGGTHRVTLGLGHSHVINSIVGEDGELKNQALPSWSLNYDYWLSDKWAVGLQSDLVIESFVIEHGGEELLEREYPFLIAVVGIFKPFRHFSFVAGYGIEHASEQTLSATRLAVEYGTHVSPRWEVGVAASWDAKWNYYDSWGLTFTVSRLFGGHH